MSGFGGDLDIAVGSVLGLRTWLYHAEARELVGLFGIKWEPSTGTGKYVAKCHSPFFGTENVIPLHSTPPNFEFPCGCGFYAYWKMEDHRLDGPNIVAGVIEGTGRTLIGGLGFRSQYAQIKGLAVTQQMEDVKEILQEKYGAPVYGDLQELLHDHPTTQDYYQEPDIKMISTGTVTAQIRAIDIWKNMVRNYKRYQS